VELVRVDVQQLSTGYRASKLLGSAVVNDASDTIGKLDDIIVSANDNKSAFAILSVGGWLGMGTHLVAFPFDSLKITNHKIMLPGATKDGLKALPQFRYNKM
jgi:sporulation protein YlmC with PRC-barrel domain